VRPFRESPNQGFMVEARQGLRQKVAQQCFGKDHMKPDTDGYLTFDVVLKASRPKSNPSVRVEVLGGDEREQGRLIVHAEHLQLDPIDGRQEDFASDANPTPARAFTYPRAVVELARRALSAGEVPRPEGLSRRQARAYMRAAFVYLKCEGPHAPWPGSLHVQFERTFGPRWDVAEEGRAHTEALRDELAAEHDADRGAACVGLREALLVELVESGRQRDELAFLRRVGG
jgi:hypothetical protein